MGLTTFCMSMPLPAAQPAGPAHGPIDPQRDRPRHLELLKPIARGAAGEVWLAKYLRAGGYCAVKFIRKDPSGLSVWYRRESWACDCYQKLTEKNAHLVRLRDRGTVGGGAYFYYSMEAADDVAAGAAIDPQTYVPCTLAHKIQAHRAPGFPPLEQLLEWMDGVLKGLAFLHRHALLHQDLKPSNIIFVGGQAKLADVGLLAPVRAEGTQAESPAGTPGYMAPDARPTFQSDLYSFGKLAYEMMTGLDRMEFPALPRGFFERPNPARWVALDRIILQACEQEPRKRPPSAGDLRRRLRAIRGGVSRPSVLGGVTGWLSQARQRMATTCQRFSDSSRARPCR